jgi:hypothetical protein
MNEEITNQPDREDPLLILLRENPNCRVTINFSRPKKKPKNPRPEPWSEATKQRGRRWYRWDYERTREGHAIVRRRGKYRWGWHFDREATPEEYKAWQLAQKEKREAKKLAKLNTPQ